MRGLVAKNIEELVPENPKQSYLSSNGVRKWKKSFWNKLSHFQRGERRKTIAVT